MAIAFLYANKYEQKYKFSTPAIGRQIENCTQTLKYY